MKKKIKISIAICFLLSILIFSGCIDIPKESTQFSIVLFKVEPDIVKQGEFANISWVVINASSVSINNGIGSVPLTGHRIIYPMQTITYKLTAYNATTSKNATITITVNPLDEYEILPFTIKLEKDEYLVQEPIIINATIKNIYNKPINIGEFRLDTGTLDFNIITPDNILLYYNGNIVSFVGKIQLLPNETTQVIYNLLNLQFGNEIINNYIFNVRGKYSIQGHYHSFATTESVIDVDLNSNIEYFTIKEI